MIFCCYKMYRLIHTVVLFSSTSFYMDATILYTNTKCLDGIIQLGMECPQVPKVRLKFEQFGLNLWYYAFWKLTAHSSVLQSTYCYSQFRIILIALSFGQRFWGRFSIILRSKVSCVWNYDQKENWSEMLFDIVNMDKARDLGSKAATRLFSGKMYIAPMIHLYHNPCIHRMWGSNPRPHG